MDLHENWQHMLDALNIEWEQTNALTDVSERTARLALLEEIEKKIFGYYRYCQETEYRRYLRTLGERGVRFVPIVNSSAVKARWTRTFASPVSCEDRKRIFYKDYRWHLFSYRLLPALSGEEARRAFDRQEKSAAFLFYQHSGEACTLTNVHLLRAADLDEDIPHPFCDLYITDPDFRWTYIRTHEADCGPYFTVR